MNFIAVVYESMPLHIRIVCDAKPWDLPRTLSQHLKNARKVDQLSSFHDGIFHTSMYSINDINIKQIDLLNYPHQNHGFNGIYHA